MAKFLHSLDDTRSIDLGQTRRDAPYEEATAPPAPAYTLTYLFANVKAARWLDPRINVDNVLQRDIYGLHFGTFRGHLTRVVLMLIGIAPLILLRLRSPDVVEPVVVEGSPPVQVAVETADGKLRRCCALHSVGESVRRELLCECLRESETAQLHPPSVATTVRRAGGGAGGHATDTAGGYSHNTCTGTAAAAPAPRARFDIGQTLQSLWSHVPLSLPLGHGLDWSWLLMMVPALLSPVYAIWRTRGRRWSQPFEL